jgi:hypothetical protein
MFAKVGGIRRGKIFAAVAVLLQVISLLLCRRRVGGHGTSFEFAHGNPCGFSWIAHAPVHASLNRRMRGELTAYV